MNSKKFLTRRNTLKIFLPAVVGIGATISLDNIIKKKFPTFALDNPNREFRIGGNKSLKERAAAKGMMYGAAVRYKDFKSSLQYAKVIVRECGMIVPSWELKWNCSDTSDGILRPNSRDFNFGHADWIIDFARSKKILVRGHTLVWHEGMPKWFEEQAHPQNAEMLLKNHIQTVVSRYAGKIHSWDVVNEALLPSDGRPDGLRKTSWLNLLGEDYIDLAFRLAHQADPKALLTYNEFGLDYDTNEDEAKRQAVLNLLQKLKSKGTPIQALGIQAHLAGARADFNQQKFRTFLKNVASLGLKIIITELDVNDQQLPLDINKRDRIIAGAYEDYLSAALDEKAVIGVITWGLDDPNSWLSEFMPRKDRAPVRTLPFDRNFDRKLAWNAIARAFDRAPKR